MTDHVFVVVTPDGTEPVWAYEWVPGDDDWEQYWPAEPGHPVFLIFGDRVLRYEDQWSRPDTPAQVLIQVGTTSGPTVESTFASFSDAIEGRPWGLVMVGDEVVSEGYQTDWHIDSSGVSTEYQLIEAFIEFNPGNEVTIDQQNENALRVFDRDIGLFGRGRDHLGVDPHRPGGAVRACLARLRHARLGGADVRGA